MNNQLTKQFTLKIAGISEAHEGDSVPLNEPMRDLCSRLLQVVDVLEEPEQPFDIGNVEDITKLANILLTRIGDDTLHVISEMQLAAYREYFSSGNVLQVHVHVGNWSELLVALKQMAETVTTIATELISAVEAPELVETSDEVEHLDSE